MAYIAFTEMVQEATIAELGLTKKQYVWSGINLYTAAKLRLGKMVYGCRGQEIATLGFINSDVKDA